MIWRRDKSSPSGRICSIEGRPIQERRQIPIARSKEVAMRWKCHGNVSAEMSFNLGKRSCGEGLMSRWFCTRHPPIHRASYCRDGKIAELGLIRLVHDCLAQLEEFASGKRFGEEVREVLVTFYVRYDKFKLVIFHDLTDKKMTPLHVFEL